MSQPPLEQKKLRSTDVGLAMLAIGVLIIIASCCCAALAAYELATSGFPAGLDVGVIVAAGMLFIAVPGLVVGAGFVYAGLKSRRRD